jgi:hypothetical protein
MKALTLPSIGDTLSIWTLIQFFYLQEIFMKIFISDMKYLIIGCSLWKFLAEKEVACGCISISVFVDSKLSVTMNITMYIVVKGEFPAEINYFVRITLMSLDMSLMLQLIIVLADRGTWKIL